MSENATATKTPEAEKKHEPKLPKLSDDIEKLTRLYELVLLFDPAEATRTWAKLEEWIKELIEQKYGAHVLRMDKWADSRKLAYEIKGLRRGTFMVVWLRAAPKILNDFERDLRLDERAVRHIVIVHDEEPKTVGMTAEEFDQKARKEDDERGSRDRGYGRR